MYYIQERTVLIETLWNVNSVLLPDGTITKGSSINRNIVECKYTSTLNSPIQQLVLIETLWNVNRARRKQFETFTEY